MPRSDMTRRAAGVTLALFLLLAGCVSAGRAARRAGEDGFVVLTSPVQIPVTAVRDSLTAFESPGLAAAAFPVFFPLYVMEHTLFTAIHAVDLVTFPAFFFYDSPSLNIYEGYDLPLVRDYNADNISQGVGMIAVFGAALALPVLVASVF